MSTLDPLLIRLPDSWPLPVVATVAMAALAALDLLGAVAAKVWAQDGNRGALVAGAAIFGLLFWVYASALQYAELAVVTMGWIVLLQVGIIVVDRVQFGATLPAGKLLAVAVILVAQGYLLLAPGSATDETRVPDDRPAMTVTAAPASAVPARPAGR